MQLSDEWIEAYENNKYLLKSPSNFTAYFNSSKVANIPIDNLTIGSVNFPSGEVVVCDPLNGLSEETTPLNRLIPKGVYDVELCVVKPRKGDSARYAAARVKFNNQEVVKYEDALTGEESFEGLEEGDYFGFDVDTGLACICDATAREHFANYEKTWYDKHPDGAFYEDCIGELFEDSFNKRPQYQRESGDWINFKLKDTDLQIPMFQSGFGDGGYPVYWGLDNTGEIAELVVQFIDIEEAYTEEEDNI